MATVNKDFRVKNGLVVEGTTAIVNGSNVLTEASTTFLNNIIKDQSGDLLANATLTNLTISYDDATNALSITAENGVGDSDTDNLSEGSTNLYFTDERAQDAFGALVSSGTYSGATVTYDDANNAFNISITDQFPSHDTDDLAEGTTNLYFTDTRAQASAATKIAASSIDNLSDVYISGWYPSADQALVYNEGLSAWVPGTVTLPADVTDALATAAADATSKADTAESNANANTDSLIGDGTVDGTAGNTVKDRIDTAVSDLIGGAPELLDTLNEIAAAIADDENFSATVVSDIATGLVDAKAYTDTREGLITTAYQTYADTAEADAIATAAADATSKANAAQAAAESTASADATSKANAAQAAAEATASADATSKANTAESNANTFTTNSIDALDTDDIEEGTSNLYFTDARAVSAIDAATVITPDSVKLNSQATLTSFQSSGLVAANATVNIFTFAPQSHLAAKLILSVLDINTNDIHASEVLIVLKYDGFENSSNVYITQYADVASNGDLFSVTAEMTDDNETTIKVTNLLNSQTFIKGYIELI